MADIEWRLLRIPLIMLFFTIMISVSLGGGSWYYQQQIQKESLQIQENLKAIEEKYQHSKQALDVYDDFSDKFKQLQQYYFLQQEERSNQWIERIEGLRNWKPYLTIMDVAIEGTQIYNVPGVRMEKDFHIKLWKLRLRMQLLHTENLLELMDYLYEHYQDGLYNIKECELMLNQPFNYQWKDHLTENPLQAGCLLQWYAAEIETKDD